MRLKIVSFVFLLSVSLNSGLQNETSYETFFKGLNHTNKTPLSNGRFTKSGNFSNFFRLSSSSFAKLTPISLKLSGDLKALDNTDNDACYRCYKNDTNFICNRCSEADDENVCNKCYQESGCETDSTDSDLCNICDKCYNQHQTEFCNKCASDDKVCDSCVENHADLVCGKCKENELSNKDIDENSTIGEILVVIFETIPRCLALMSYFFVQLIRALLELVLEILIALVSNLGLGTLGGSLVELLETIQDIVHNALSVVAEVLVPENIVESFESVINFFNGILKI